VSISIRIGILFNDLYFGLYYLAYRYHCRFALPLSLAHPQLSIRKIKSAISVAPTSRS
jgi:hypothetical protein